MSEKAEPIVVTQENEKPEAIAKKTKKKKSVQALLADLPAETKDERGELMFTHKDPTNPRKLLGTLANLRNLMDFYKIIIKYNVISKRIHHTIPHEGFSPDNEEESALACIYSYMKEWKLPVDGYKLYLTRIADGNQYNPVLQWVRSRPWDGVSRLADLYATIESPETEAKELLIRRWLITAMSMACQHNVDSAGCLVLQGEQGIGKTWWVRKLVDERLVDELVRSVAGFDPHDRDKLSQLISYWIVELGDIGSTFRRSDIDALKNFITDNKDIFRRPYGEGDKRYPRRTALIASVDQAIYLHDTAGNRRFWTIPCTSVNSRHTIDMQQLWAEVLELIEKHGETPQLDADEKAHVTRINQEHMQIDPIFEMILEKYRWDEINYINEWKTATEIAKDLGIKNITVKETRIISAHVAKINGNKKRSSNGKRVLLVAAVRQL